MVVVHDIEVDNIRPGCQYVFNLFSKTGKIG